MCGFPRGALPQYVRTLQHNVIRLGKKKTIMARRIVSESYAITVP